MVVGVPSAVLTCSWLMPGRNLLQIVFLELVAVLGDGLGAGRQRHGKQRGKAEAAQSAGPALEARTVSLVAAHRRALRGRAHHSSRPPRIGRVPRLDPAIATTVQFATASRRPCPNANCRPTDAAQPR